ncbi:expressed unknown protein [Seminavis robusta]|uniref:Uncharacterized protein n=1 Tax=Seminavis robusta TaxID=568900 RepID=A0A9N8DCZ6_9STRA|nr:expressed unknown protein [Seminavis robusta]|eukprot:Sro66_g037330.1 n/a (787) ;mRNA; r:119594-121954
MSSNSSMVEVLVCDEVAQADHCDAEHCRHGKSITVYESQGTVWKCKLCKRHYHYQCLEGTKRKCSFCGESSEVEVAFFVQEPNRSDRWATVFEGKPSSPRRATTKEETKKTASTRAISRNKQVIPKAPDSVDVVVVDGKSAQATSTMSITSSNAAAASEVPLGQQESNEPQVSERPLKLQGAAVRQNDNSQNDNAMVITLVDTSSHGLDDDQDTTTAKNDKAPTKAPVEASNIPADEQSPVGVSNEQTQESSGDARKTSEVSDESMEDKDATKPESSNGQSTALTDVAMEDTEEDDDDSLVVWIKPPSKKRQREGDTPQNEAKITVRAAKNHKVSEGQPNNRLSQKRPAQRNETVVVREESNKKDGWGPTAALGAMTQAVGNLIDNGKSLIANRKGSAKKKRSNTRYGLRYDSDSSYEEDTPVKKYNKTKLETKPESQFTAHQRRSARNHPTRPTNQTLWPDHVLINLCDINIEDPAIISLGTAIAADATFTKEHPYPVFTASPLEHDQDATILNVSGPDPKKGGSILTFAHFTKLVSQGQLVSGDVTTAYLSMLSRSLSQSGFPVKTTGDFVWGNLQRIAKDKGDWKKVWPTVLQKQGARKTHYNLIDDTEAITVLQLFEGNSKAGHFACVVIDRRACKSGIFTFLDSGKAYKFTNMRRMRKCFEDLGFSNQNSIWIDANVPQQAFGTNDCGVWMCMLVATFLRALKRIGVGAEYRKVTTSITSGRLQQQEASSWFIVDGNLTEELVGWCGRAYIGESLFQGDVLLNQSKVLDMLDCHIDVTVNL